MTPVQVTSGLACTNGANKYCNAVMGAMGLNVLDAAFVLFCQVKLFGAGASDACVNDIGSVPMQEDIVDSLSKSLGGPDVFHPNTLDVNSR